MEFKADFERTRTVWKRFWDGELKERPALLMDVSNQENNSLSPQAPHPYNLAVKPLTEIIDKIERWAASRHFFGDRVPSYRVTFAPDHFALLLGADVTHTEYEDGRLTGWVIPFLENYNQEIRFRPDCKWYQKTVECANALRERFDGRIIISWPALQGGLDALSAIRGPQRLLMDIVTIPKSVKDALCRIDHANGEARKALEKDFGVEQFGSVSRHGMYHPGRVDIPQCDFSAMISEEMFREFALPSLKNECISLDAAEYHLDGPEAIHHLEAICEVDTIKVIQWQPGAGKAASRDWSTLYDRIDNLGKGQIRGATMKEAIQLWKCYKSNYLCFNIGDVKSRAQAEDFIAEFQNISRDE